MNFAAQPTIQRSSLSESTAVNLLAYACHSPHEQRSAGFAEIGERRIMAFVEPSWDEHQDAGWPSVVAKEGSD
jgi:hypothetical protein